MNTHTLIKELKGTIYKQWDGNNWTNSDTEPFYANSNPVINIDYVKSIGCNCSGLINLLLRNKGIEIPDVNSCYPGGTYAYGLAFKWERYDVNKIYPKYSLFLRPYIFSLDEGHIGILNQNNNLVSSVPEGGVKEEEQTSIEYYGLKFVCTDLCEKLNE